MIDEELIARLRKADEYEPLGHDGWEAADRIEALTKERDQWISHAKTAIWSDSEELKETERKLAKAVEALEWQASQPEAHPFMAQHARTTLAEIKGT